MRHSLRVVVVVVAAVVAACATPPQVVRPSDILERLADSGVDLAIYSEGLKTTDGGRIPLKDLFEPLVAIEPTVPIAVIGAMPSVGVVYQSDGGAELVRGIGDGGYVRDDGGMVATTMVVPVPGASDGGVADTGDKCRDVAGFGLTVPAVSVRHRVWTDGPIDTEIRGPVSGGIGVGYYAPVVCGKNRLWSLGFNFGAFSQGFATTNLKFQFGILGGFQIGVTRLFRFGIGLGYDLYRWETISRPIEGEPEKSTNVDIKNGLFAFQNVGAPSLTYMFTLEVSDGALKSAEGK